MTTRTLQFYGYGIGVVPVTVTATFDGTTVYSGEIYTTSVPGIPDRLQEPGYPTSTARVLFTASVDLNFSGTKPMSITVNSGSYAVVNAVLLNYCPNPNPVFTDLEEYQTMINPATPAATSTAIFAKYANPAFSAEDLVLVESTNPADKEARSAVLAAHGVTPLISSGADIFRRRIYDDCHTNVKIDGTDYVAERFPDSNPGDDFPGCVGNYDYTIPSGSTLSYDLRIVAGKA
jgi:hypothetical protein